MLSLALRVVSEHTHSDAPSIGNEASLSPVASFLSSLTKPEILLPNLTVAAVLAAMNVTTAISIAALIFSGLLAPYLSNGIGLYLVGTAVGGVLVAAGSGYKGVIAGPRSGQAPIVAALAAGIVLSMDGQPDEVIVATVIAAILAASLFISVVLFGIGWAKLGGLVRYIPYPVMGGFFAGLGFLLFKGGFLVSVGTIASIDDPASFLSQQALLHLLPALLFAVLLYVLDQKISHWLLMPAYLVATIAVFYGVLFATGGTVEGATANQWLPSIDTSQASFLPVFTLEMLNMVDWYAILGQTSTILVMALMSVIMLLLDTSGVEIVIDRDLDPNHELRTTGWANFINGLCTGVISIQAAADTAFASKLGGNRFLMVLIYGLLVFGIVLVGPAPIAYVPTLLLGGLLMYIGIDFLMAWVWNLRKKLPLPDFAVVCGILLVVATVGILEGVAVGIILAILLFVHSYSQLSVIKSSQSGTEHVSNIDRDRKQSIFLDEHGDALHIFVLQGFLFFGTASRLLEDIRSLIDDPNRPTVRYLVLDFQRVDAMDTSAANSFMKLKQVCEKDGVALVFTSCSTEIIERLGNLFSSENPAESLRIFEDLEEGVAWCDDRILENFDGKAGDTDPVDLLTDILGNAKAAKILAPGFQKTALSSGQELFHQGEEGNALYIIINGSVSVVLELPNGNKLNLRTMRAGAVLGEMAIYTGAERSASALAVEDCDLYRLDREAFSQMNEQHPFEAGLFHSFIVRLMSERLGRANKEIIALSR